MNGTAKFIKKTKQIDSFLLVSAFKDLKQNSANIVKENGIPQVPMLLFILMVMVELVLQNIIGGVFPNVKGWDKGIVDTPYAVIVA